MTVGERLNESLREITQPIITQLREIELEIATREAEMKELVEARRKLTTIARQIDPELVPKKQQASKASALISDAKVNEVYEWLKANVNGDEFYASGLTKDANYNVTSQSQTAKALAVLHERGQIRLVRQGSGGSKHFKLVSA